MNASNFYPFADWQYNGAFPFDRPDRTRSNRWLACKRVSGGDDVLIPASCIYVPYKFDRNVEPFSHIPISTGLACGPNFDFALSKAVLEILERDALMIVWHGELPTVSVEVESLRGISGHLDKLLRLDNSSGTHWCVNIISLDVDVPIVCAFLRDADGLPKTSFGVAADRDLYGAILRSMEEALLTRFLLNRSDLLVADIDALQSPKTLRGHMLAHAVSRDVGRGLEFLINADRTLSFSEAKEKWDHTYSSSFGILEAVTRAGFEIIYLDITTDDVRELGLCVIRAFLPGAQPLDNDHRFPYLGGTRLVSVPAMLGMFAKYPCGNPRPHPFP